MNFTLRSIINPDTGSKVQMLMAQALKTLLQDIHCEKVKYRANDLSDMRLFGFRLIQKVRKLHPGFCTMEKALEILTKAWHIETSLELAELFITYRNELTKAGYKMGPITGATNRGSSGKMNKREANKRIRRLNMETAVKAMKRAVVCRSQFGDYDIRFYEISESLTTKKGAMLNMIKGEYVADTGCPYYQVRPILMSSWLKLPEYEQYCTSK